MTSIYAKRWVLTRLWTSQGKHLENVQNRMLREFGEPQRLGAKAPREVGRQKLLFEICDLKNVLMTRRLYIALGTVQFVSGVPV